MKLFLVGAIASAVVFALASFAIYRDLPTTSPLKVQAVTPLRYADLTLNRIVRIPFSLTVGSAATVQMPLTSGLVVDSITGGNLEISVNGVALGVTGTLLPSQPPLVFRPGDTIALSATGTGGTQVNLILHGWTVFAGEV